MEYSKGYTESPSLKHYTPPLPIHAVLMAGGLGSRLGELTQNLPKPLLKIGEKRIIDYLLLLLQKHHITDINIAIRYLGHKIIHHLLQSPPPLSMHLRFIKESQPLGTFGAISLLEAVKFPYILVINSDLVTTINLTELFLQMKATGADMIIASATYPVEIPYGILKLEEGSIEKFVEKPTYSFEVNAGIYLFKREVLSLVPRNKFFDAPEFVDLLLAKGKKVHNFPIQGYWQDISQPDDYEIACQNIHMLSFD
ncbi:MAG: sugar phosphate nucleotidyltransferase [Bacteroidota bacterium]